MSDDGSRLWIDNSEVVNNDGYHATGERGSAVTLAAGWHAIHVGFFQSPDYYSLRLDWAGPGISRQTVPQNRLSTRTV